MTQAGPARSMDQWLTLLGTNNLAGSGTSGPGRLTLACVVLIILAGVYAGLILNADRLPRWLRVPVPAGLRARIVIALVPMAILPVLCMALILGPRTGGAISVALLVITLVVSLGLAVALARSICAPLASLEAAVRRFDPDLRHDAPQVPPDSPHEVAVLFRCLANTHERQHAANARLQHSLQQGERLRRELISVLEARETEIKDRAQELTQANALLERLSRIDALTGVANRQGLAEFLDRAWRTAQREHHPVAVLMIDVDHFLAYTDAYGQPRGDTCLQAVANAISYVVGRSTDLVTRFGSAEFVVVLGNTPLESALLVGEQIRATVEALAIPHQGAPSPGVVTVSIGVSSSLPTREAQFDIGLDAADRALYAAKEQGCNRVGYSSVAHTGLFQSLCLPNEPGSRPS